jgi:hypothetical protein
MGISKDTFLSLFGSRPPSFGASSDDATAYDFAALDQLLPHPVYGHIYWVCVLNPSTETFQSLKPLLAEAYELAVGKYDRRFNRQ